MPQVYKAKPGPISSAHNIFLWGNRTYTKIDRRRQDQKWSGRRDSPPRLSAPKINHLRSFNNLAGAVGAISTAKRALRNRYCGLKWGQIMTDVREIFGEQPAVVQTRSRGVYPSFCFAAFQRFHFCRDRIPKRHNPLGTGVVDGNLSTLWEPRQRLLNPHPLSMVDSNSLVRLEGQVFVAPI